MKLVFEFGRDFFAITHTRFWWPQQPLNKVTIKLPNGDQTTLAEVLQDVKKL